MHEHTPIELPGAIEHLKQVKLTDGTEVKIVNNLQPETEKRLLDLLEAHHDMYDDGGPQQIPKAVDREQDEQKREENFVNDSNPTPTFDPEQATTSPQTTKEPAKTKTVDLDTEITVTIGGELEPEQEEQLLQAPRFYRQQYYTFNKQPMVATDAIENEINTGDHPPIKLKTYHLTLEKREFVNEKIQELLDQRIIEYGRTLILTFKSRLKLELQKLGRVCQT